MPLSSHTTMSTIDPFAALTEAKALLTLGDQAGALKILDTARQQHPETAEILFMMAGIFHGLNQFNAAARLYEALTHLRPNDVAVRNNYANALHALGDLRRAEEQIEVALAHRMGMPELWVTKGVIAESQQRYELAEQAFSHALALKPDHGPALSGLAAMLSARGAYAKAVVARERAMQVVGDRPSLRLNQAYDLFRLERWNEAWSAYEGRMQEFPGEPAPVKARPFSQPRWQGQKLTESQTLLVWMEQGVGEELMYASMLPDVQRRCPQVLVECEARLVTLFKRSFPSITFVARRAEPDQRCLAEDVVAQIPAASLGTYLRREKHDFPLHMGYLKPDPQRVEVIRARWQQQAPSKKLVGISWRSKAYKFADPKSSQLEEWGQLMSQRNVQFINLQYGDTLEDMRMSKLRDWPLLQDPTVDPTRDLDIFAAQVAACDLIVTVSNATAHMAGALGKKAHVLLPYGLGTMFHWLVSRTDSPWYPSLTLWRQKTAGDWKTLFGMLARLI